MGYKKDPRYNASGCKDLTAYEALSNIEREERRLKKLISALHTVADLAGYTIDNRITVTDKRTGKTWR